MNSKPPHIGDRLQEWITARKRHHLSHAHVQMARELGMNPRKVPLPAFIESLYRKRFGKDRPDEVHSIEERARHLEQKKAARREARRSGREEAP